MLQTQQSGAAANDFGRTTAPKIAQAIGATMSRKGSNEATLNGQRIVIKMASAGTTSVGVSKKMLGHLDAVVAAFQREGKTFDLIALSAIDYAKHMSPTRSKGPSAGKVGIVRKSAFASNGRKIAVVDL